MKRITLLVFSTFLLFPVYSQVFNTASTLKKGDFNIGIEPVIFSSAGNNDLYLFLNGGLGLSKGTDLNLRLGVLNNETFIGGDIEFNLAKFFSVSAGAHSFYDFALDGTGLFTFPVGSAKLFTGLDVDIVFSDDTRIPIWVPVGIEFFLRKKLAFIFEAEIALETGDAYYHIFGGGLNYYF